MTNLPITLRDAAAQNDAATVMQLLQAGAPIDEFDGSALRAALRHEHPDTIPAAEAPTTGQGEPLASADKKPKASTAWRDTKCIGTRDPQGQDTTQGN